MDALQQGSGSFGHGQTYQGHPLACRAALEVQRIVQENDLVSNVRKQGVLLGKLLKARLGGHPAVGDVRGKGLFWGIEFVRDKGTKEPFAPGEAVAMGVHELGKSASNPSSTLDVISRQYIQTTSISTDPCEQACKNPTTYPYTPVPDLSMADRGITS